MFGRRFFGNRFFGGRYWGHAGLTATPAEPPLLATIVLRPAFEGTVATAPALFATLDLHGADL